MTVITPPKMHENDSGIRNLDGEKPRVRAQSPVMGISRATIGVLLKKAESTKVRDMSLTSPNLRLVCRPNTCFAALSLLRKGVQGGREQPDGRSWSDLKGEGREWGGGSTCATGKSLTTAHLGIS